MNEPEEHLPTAMLRPATMQDMAAIMALERLPEFHTLVGTWTEEEHVRAFHNPDVQYLMVLDAAGANAGFAILRGLLSPHKNLELKRFVIAAPGSGMGQRALAALLTHAFHSLGAHRFWLDVFETNHRALHVYRKAGFRQEGVLREAIYRDGEFHTLLLFAMLDREYGSQASR